MNQKKDQAPDQFMYLGRWVSRKNFRAYVYSTDEKTKLVNSYDEFDKSLESGEWFASKELAKPIPIVKSGKKQKNGANS
jgi:hypothetical protein